MLLAAYMLVPGPGRVGRSSGSARAGKPQLVVSWPVTVPFTFWAGLIGGCFLTMVARHRSTAAQLLTCRNQRESQRPDPRGSWCSVSSRSSDVGMMLHVPAPLPPMATSDEIFPPSSSVFSHGIAGW